MNILSELEKNGVMVSNWASSYKEELDNILENHQFAHYLMQTYAKGKLNEVCISRFVNGVYNRNIATDQVFIAAVEKWVMIWVPSKKQMLIYRVL